MVKIKELNISFTFQAGSYSEAASYNKAASHRAAGSYKVAQIKKKI